MALREAPHTELQPVYIITIGKGTLSRVFKQQGNTCHALAATAHAFGMPVGRYPASDLQTS